MVETTKYDVCYDEYGNEIVEIHDDATESAYFDGCKLITDEQYEYESAMYLYERLFN